MALSLFAFVAAGGSEWMEGRPSPSGFQSWLAHQQSLDCQTSDSACEPLN